MIEHLTDKDYLTSYDGKTFSNLGERIENVENEKEILKTAKLKNTKPIFTIGTDKDGIDISNGISDGEVSVELQGQTLINLWGNKTSDFQLHHLATFNDGWITANGNSLWVDAFSKKSELFKPSTDYTLILFVKQNTLNNKFNVIADYNGHSVFTVNQIQLNTGSVGTFMYKVTTKSDLTGCSVGVRSQIPSSVTEGSITFQIVALEGDHTNKSIEYFEGIKSVGETSENKIEISSVGKNLLDYNTITKGYYDYSSMTNAASNSAIYRNFIIHLSKGTYTLTYPTSVLLIRAFTDKIRNGQIISELKISGKTGNTITFQMPHDGNLYLGWRHSTSIETQWDDTDNLSIQLEKGETSTKIEAHKSNKKEIILNEPLHGLPDGTCDEIIGNQIIRRVGKYTFNGSEPWTRRESEHGEFTSMFYSTKQIGIKKGTAQSGYCDKFPVGNYWFATNDVEGVHIGQGNVALYFRINRSKLATDDVAGITSWLNSNPITVYFPLETPITEEIEPIILDSYENGTLFIDSTIVPTSIHQVTLKNMNFLVEKNIEEIAKLRERLNKLKSFYDVSLLEMDYELSKEKLTYYLATYGLGE